MTTLDTGLRRTYKVGLENLKINTLVAVADAVNKDIKNKANKSLGTKR